MTFDCPPQSLGYVAGLPVTSANVDQAVDLLWDSVEKGLPRVYVLVNAYSATLRRRSEYAAVLRDDAVTPLADGASLTAGAILVGRGEIGRCPGPDLFERAALRAAGDGTSFYLLGGGEGVVDELAATLQARFPGLRIAGAATPPYGVWTDEQHRALVEQVRASDADILWMGVSAPKQETWAVRWHEDVGRPIVCVGAAFDFLSGRKARAPLWMRRIGAEWLFRLLSEPRRLLWRYLAGNTVFLVDLIHFRNKAPF